MHFGRPTGYGRGITSRCGSGWQCRWTLVRSGADLAIHQPIHLHELTYSPEPRMQRTLFAETVNKQTTSSRVPQTGTGRTKLKAAKMTDHGRTLDGSPLTR